MGELIVVTGPPGAGKSTVAELLVDRFDKSALVPGDDFFEFVRAGRIDPWRPESHAQNTVVTRAAAAAAGRLTEHCDVVYDGVIGPWFVDTFLAHTGAVRLHYALLLPSLDDCVGRVSSRVGHGFTDLAAAAHMWSQFADAVDGYQRHIVDGAGDPEQIAREILRRVEDGHLVRH